MNVRSRNPAAGTASTRTRRIETSISTYIAAVSTRYGTTEVARSSKPSRRQGLAYGASRSRQKSGGSGARSVRAAGGIVLAGRLHGQHADGRRARSLALFEHQPIVVHQLPLEARDVGANP